MGVVIGGLRVQIIHLIRDPRFQYQSRLRTADFPCERADIRGYCRAYSGDTPSRAANDLREVFTITEKAPTQDHKRQFRWF